MLTRIWHGIAAAGILTLVASTSAAAGDDAWQDFRRELFASRVVDAAKSGELSLYVPSQAADGAAVPISIHMPDAVAQSAVRLTIIIDRNPAPVAAVVKFGNGWRRAGPIGDRIFSTRVRVDAFSQIRAVLETSDGRLIMSDKFVAGAGGCSALPSKDPDEALAQLGRAKITASSHELRARDWREGSLMIRHPNFTGMQMDPGLGTYTPARYVSEIEVSDGTESIFTIEGNISLSEDPNFRFTYVGTSDRLIMRGADSDGTRLEAETPGVPS